MIPTSFDKDNSVADCGDPDSIPLSVCATQDKVGRDVIISCWKFTEDEISELQETGRVWLIIGGSYQPQLALTAINLFKT